MHTIKDGSKIILVRTRRCGAVLKARQMVDAGTPRCHRQRTEKEGANLIVMSSHCRSELTRMLIGSVTAKVLRAAPCPMLSSYDRMTKYFANDKLHKAAVDEEFKVDSSRRWI